MRPVSIMAKPSFQPYVCVNCGVGDKPRIWFIELGINLDLYYNPVNEGNLYFCNECWESISREVAKSIQLFLYDTLPWIGEGFIKPTYENKDELIESRRDNNTVTTIDDITTRDDQESNGSPKGDKSSDPAPEPSLVPGESSDVREFRDFFSGSGNSTI